MRIQPVKIFDVSQTEAREAHNAWAKHFKNQIYKICKDADAASELAKSEENACTRTGIDWGFYSNIDRRLGFKVPKK